MIYSEVRRDEQPLKINTLFGEMVSDYCSLLIVELAAEPLNILVCTSAFLCTPLNE